MVIELTEKDFDAKIGDNSKPVLVDFWAPWCGPCRSIAPVVEELSGEFSDKMVFCKLNVDDSPSIPGRYGIRSIPTIMIFKNGQLVNQVTGAVSKGNLQEVIEKAL